MYGRGEGGGEASEAQPDCAKTTTGTKLKVSGKTYILHFKSNTYARTHLCDN